ncbi:MAG: aldehyde ferredoxin oxidoreductase family protein [Planctomycetota bacterium]
MNGWIGKILRVNLSDGSIREEAADKAVWPQYLGGRGYGAYVLFNEVGPDIKPLDEKNLLIFATGALTGTKAPTPSRYSVTTKSPLTGTICDANSGGKWGVELKKCGYDALIISGKSNSHVYLNITDSSVEIKPAASLWGKDTLTACRILREENNKNASVLCIGVAGENLVKISSIINDGSRSLARGGSGAVMGSKNLKAIVTKGNKKINIADEEKMQFFSYEANKLLRAHPLTSKGLPEFGTAILMEVINAAGILPARNFQDSQFSNASNVSGVAIVEKIMTGRAGCYGCVIRCTRKTKTKTAEGEGPEYESAWALGPDCGIDDLETVAEANYLCNLLGLDTISTGATIACAMELGEKGIFETRIRFGQNDKIKKLIRQIACREGIGDELAEGSKNFALKHNAEYYSMSVKGLEMPAYDPRGAQGQGLGYATSNRGACHLRGGYLIAPELLGVPRIINRFCSVGKAGHAVHLQNLGAALDSLAACRFASFALSEVVWARLLTAVTGINYNSEELMKTGERIYNLERMYNIREGFSRKDDSLPKRLQEEPVKNGPAKDCVVRLQEMLDEYYEFRGWNNNGVPTDKKLKELGLKELCDVNRKV